MDRRRPLGCTGVLWLALVLGLTVAQDSHALISNAGIGAQLRGIGDACRAAVQEGDLDRAEDLARQRVAIAASANRERWVGNALTLLAKVLRLRGRYRESEALLAKALPLVESGDGPDSISTIRTLENLSQIEMSEGRYAEAKAYNTQALERARRAHATSLEMLQALNVRAAIESLLHRDAEALVLLDQAAALQIDQVGVLSREVEYTRIRTLHERGVSEYRLGRYPSAREHLQQAIEGYTRLGSENFDSVAAAEGLGFVYQALGDERSALQLFRANLATAQQILGPAHPMTARIEGVLASALAALGERSEAQRLHQHAMAVLVAASAPEFLAYEARLDAQFETAGGDLKGALAALRLALDAIDAEYAETRGLDAGTREDFIARYAPYYVETLMTLLALHEAEPGAGYDREALEVVSRTQSRFFSELMRQADVSRFSSNPDYLSLRRRQKEAQEQLAASREERAAAAQADRDDSEASLSDPLEERDDEEASGAREPRASVPHSTRRYDEGSAARRAVARHGEDPLVASRRAARAHELDQNIREETRKLEAINGELWSRFPRYMELSQPRAVSVEQLQRQVLRKEEVLLTYFLLPNETLAFVLTRSDLHLVRLPLRREAVGELVAALRSPEDNPDADLGGLKRLSPALLHEAFEELVAPLEPLLGGAERILVIGDGPLLTLPLEMLVTRWSPEEERSFQAARAEGRMPLAEYQGLAYLGERYQFAYLPSLSTFVSMRLYAKPTVSYQTELVSFADPLFEGAPRPPVGGVEGALLQRSLGVRDGQLSVPRLPETADEARGIAGILGGQSHLYLRADAQEHTAKTIDLKSVRFLHFATHGLLGGEFAPPGPDDAVAGRQALGPEAPSLPDERAEPALLLSLAGDLQGEDGLLTAREVVQSLNLNAQLVVLSACNTAGGHDAAHSGEGVAGLTRAFAFAGAHGLVVSHWTVESESTKETMLALFRDLKAGFGPTNSLARARAAIRSGTVKVTGVEWSRAHPFFWAPFVYVGD